MIHRCSIGNGIKRCIVCDHHIFSITNLVFPPLLSQIFRQPVLCLKQICIIGEWYNINVIKNFFLYILFFFFPSSFSIFITSPILQPCQNIKSKKTKKKKPTHTFTANKHNNIQQQQKLGISSLLLSKVENTFIYFFNKVFCVDDYLVSICTNEMDSYCFTERDGLKEENILD